MRAGLPVIAARLVPLHALARDSRGSASIELALGAVLLISTSMLCFDLYSRIKADTAVARVVATMADYVSRDANPNGDEMKELGTYLYDHELDVPANLVYVITAFHQPPGDPRPDVAVLWSDNTIQFGDSTVTEDLAAECARFGGEGEPAELPAGFTMSDDEVLIVAEVCARLTGAGFLTGKFISGDIYRLHALPARDPDQQPARPAYTALQGARAVAVVAAWNERAGGVSRRETQSFAVTASA